MRRLVRRLGQGNRGADRLSRTRASVLRSRGAQEDARLHTPGHRDVFTSTLGTAWLHTGQSRPRSSSPPTRAPPRPHSPGILTPATALQGPGLPLAGPSHLSCPSAGDLRRPLSPRASHTRPCLPQRFWQLLGGGQSPRLASEESGVSKARVRPTQGAGGPKGVAPAGCEAPLGHPAGAGVGRGAGGWCGRRAAWEQRQLGKKQRAAGARWPSSPPAPRGPLPEASVPAWAAVRCVLPGPRSPALSTPALCLSSFTGSCP